MQLNKKDIASNLRLFGYKKFGSMKKFAEALDMNPSTLYSGYLNSRSIPGPVLLVKLMNLGCNIYWLLTSSNTSMPENNDYEKIKKLEEENTYLRSQVARAQQYVTHFSNGKKKIEKLQHPIVR